MPATCGVTHLVPVGNEYRQVRGMWSVPEEGFEPYGRDLWLCWPRFLAGGITEGQRLAFGSEGGRVGA